MSKYQEVEVKYPLYNRDEVINNINQRGLEVKLENETQNDSYYTPSHRNFLEPPVVSEWLRIRKTKGKCSLNFKQWLPIGAEVQNQCNEYETKIDDAYAVKKILELLDFKEIIIVNKTRNSWIYGNVEISIDHVDHLGDFIELESTIKVNDDQITYIHEKFTELLVELGAVIGKRDHRGYPYLLLEKSNLIGEGK